MIGMHASGRIRVLKTIKSDGILTCDLTKEKENITYERERGI